MYIYHVYIMYVYQRAQTRVLAISAHHKPILVHNMMFFLFSWGVFQQGTWRLVKSWPASSRIGMVSCRPQCRAWSTRSKRGQDRSGRMCTRMCVCIICDVTYACVYACCVCVCNCARACSCVLVCSYACMRTRARSSSYIHSRVCSIHVCVLEQRFMYACLREVSQIASKLHSLMSLTAHYIKNIDSMLYSCGIGQA